MDNILSDISKLRENLESAAFLVSRGESEREAHGKIVESIVIVSQLEAKVKNNPSNFSSRRKSYIAPAPQPQNEVNREVNKVTRRLPRWFRNSSQYNSTILYTYLKLSEQSPKVSLLTLRKECSSVQDFYGNYNQMKNFGEKNHGKVFEERDGYVTLWEPVKDYILELYNENKA